MADHIRKFCGRCGKEQYFAKRKNNTSYCMQCNREHTKKWAKLNPGVRNRWARANPEKARAADKRKREKHKGKIREMQKKHYQLTKEQIRDYNLRRAYKISAVEYDLMLTAQNSLCLICGKTNRNGRRLSVDHNHETGEIRGLICNGCNRMLGYANDSISVLGKAIEYLKKAGHK